MAGGSLYQDSDEQAGITDINVTPFVDVVLVLLVVFMVTAKLIVARGIDAQLPKAASGGDLPAKLRIVVKDTGELFIGNTQFTDDAAAIARIKELAAETKVPKAVIAGDARTAYGGVMHAIDLANQAGVGIALENLKKEP
jgi:biopolymer transport protein ExbD